MSYPDPIAYTYEADYHCPACTEARFGRCPDDHFIACPDDPRGAAHYTDSEGNPVSVVAPWDEWQDVRDESRQWLACGTCGRVIEEFDNRPEGGYCDRDDGAGHEYQPRPE